jgi:hypothetical protein
MSQAEIVGGVIAALDARTAKAAQDALEAQRANERAAAVAAQRAIEREKARCAQLQQEYTQKGARERELRSLALEKAKQSGALQREILALDHQRGQLAMEMEAMRRQHPFLK